MSGALAVLTGASKKSLTVSANNVTGKASGYATSGTVTSSIPSTNPEGGKEPYTYLWEKVSGSSAAVSDSTARNPSWSDTVGGFVPETAVWRVTVTDADGETAQKSINVSLRWISLM